MKIKEISFSSVGKNEGCTCDRCGQYIKNIMTVKYADGLCMNYGVDCFSKLCKESSVQSNREKELKKAIRRIDEYTKRLEKWKNLTEEQAEEQHLIEELKVTDWNTSYWAGKTFEEYKTWLIESFFPYRISEAQKEIDKLNVNLKR